MINFLNLYSGIRNARGYKTGDHSRMVSIDYTHDRRTGSANPYPREIGGGPSCGLQLIFLAKRNSRYGELSATSRLKYLGEVRVVFDLFDQVDQL